MSGTELITNAAADPLRIVLVAPPEAADPNGCGAATHSTGRASGTARPTYKLCGIKPACRSAGTTAGPSSVTDQLDRGDDGSAACLRRWSRSGRCSAGTIGRWSGCGSGWIWGVHREPSMRMRARLRRQVASQLRVLPPQLPP